MKKAIWLKAMCIGMLIAVGCYTSTDAPTQKVKAVSEQVVKGSPDAIAIQFEAAPVPVAHCQVQYATELQDEPVVMSYAVLIENVSEGQVNPRNGSERYWC